MSNYWQNYRLPPSHLPCTIPNMAVRPTILTEYITFIKHVVSGNFRQAKEVFAGAFKSEYANSDPKINTPSPPTVRAEQFSRFAELSGQAKAVTSDWKTKVLSITNPNAAYLRAWGGMFSDQDVRGLVERLTVEPNDKAAKIQLSGICNGSNISKMPLDLQIAVKKVLAN